MIFKTNSSVSKVFISLVFVLCSLVATAHREQTYYLHGNFEGKAIAIQIDEYGDACFAHYFVEDNLYDRVLEGNISIDSVFNLAMYRTDPETKSRIAFSTLIIKEGEEHTWHGTWSREGKPEQEINLYPINIDSLQHTFEDTIKRYKISPYSALRLQNISIKMGKIRKAQNGVNIIDVSNPETGIEFFLLQTKKGSEIQTDSINLFLKYQMLKEIDAYYNCTSTEGTGIYNVSFELHFVNPYVLNYAFTLQSSCYGGEPRTNTSQVCLSIQNAKPIALENMLWFSDNPLNNLSEGEYEWFQYRYKIFAPKIYEMLKFLYPKKLSSGDECSVDAEKYWQLPNWYFSEKGLHLQATSNYTNTCKKDWFLIPFEELNQYINKSFELPTGK